METQVEALTIPPQTGMQRLAALSRGMRLLKSDIKAAEDACGISVQKEQLAQMDTEFSVLLAKVSGSVTFSEDSFLKAIKKRGDSYREGQAKIIRTSVTRRTIDRARFVAAHRGLALEICTIPIKAAEDAIGKRALDALCEKSISYSYQFVDLAEHCENEGV